MSETKTPVTWQQLTKCSGREKHQLDLFLIQINNNNNNYKKQLKSTLVLNTANATASTAVSLLLAVLKQWNWRTLPPHNHNTKSDFQRAPVLVVSHICSEVSHRRCVVLWHKRHFKQHPREAGYRFLESGFARKCTSTSQLYWSTVVE